MKMFFPGVKARQKIVGHLERFFDEYQKDDFEIAIRLLAEYYETKIPNIQFYEYINHGKWGGVTWEDGKIHLEHPENWKQAKTKVTTRHAWVFTVLHEFAHFLYWADAETKADWFANRFIRGEKK